MQERHHRDKGLPQQIAVLGQQARKKNARAGQADTTLRWHEVAQERQEQVGIRGAVKQGDNRARPLCNGGMAKKIAEQVEKLLQ